MKKQKTVTELSDSIIEKAAELKKIQELRKYYKMKYPLVDDIIKEHTKQSFEIKFGSVTIKEKFIVKPKHRKVSFWQKLKYVWDVVVNKAFVVYYFEDVKKNHPKLMSAYLTFQEPKK